MKVRLADQQVTIGAPRPMVFQMLNSFGQGGPGQNGGERSRVVERDGDRLLVEFVTRAGKRSYRTLEQVMLYPPGRITFRHLEGPLHHASEEFRLEEEAEGTRLSYRGVIECRARLPGFPEWTRWVPGIGWFPGVGWLSARFYVRPKYNRLIREHLSRLKVAAEARAARSHLFRRTPTAGTE